MNEDLALAFEEKAAPELIIAAVIGPLGANVRLGSVPAGKVLPWDILRPHVGHAAGFPTYAWTPTRILWDAGGQVMSLPRNPTDTPHG